MYKLVYNHMLIDLIFNLLRQESYPLEPSPVATMMIDKVSCYFSS